jgi:hypothetical protein
MLKPPIVRPEVDEPTIIKVEYYEVVMPNGSLLIQRDSRGNIKCAFDDIAQAEQAVRAYNRGEAQKLLQRHENTRVEL